MFVEVLRRHIEGLPEESRGWLSGLRDPHVGHALRLIHGRPTEPWTLEKLAQQVGLSRAAFASRFTEFVGAKRGLAAALHSGNPAFEPLSAYFQQRFEPALGSLLAAAAAAGEIRGDVKPLELLHAVSRLCSPAGVDHSGDERMVGLLIDGLRFGAKPER